MAIKSYQTDMFIDPAVLELINSLKNQLDSTRKKLFAELSEAKEEIEFLSLQLQTKIEREDGINDFGPYPGG